jgi:GntR family transcriptional regulator
MPIQLDPSRPIYLQIMEEIKKRAIRGVYPPGSQLPSVRDMAREMEVNPNTVSRVYMELEREGFIATRRGQGSFLTVDPALLDRERERIGREATRRFIEVIRELGLPRRKINDITIEVTHLLSKKADEGPSSREE